MPFTDPYVANPFPFSFANTLPLANTLYDVTASLVSGVYTISWSGGGTLNIDFYNGTTLVTSVSGTSSITVNLAQSVTNYKMWCTVAPISAILSLSGLSVAPISGTVYTYTTSQTITLTGDAYGVLIGGGGGGGGGLVDGGGGGGSGAIVTLGRLLLTGSQALVVGAAGAGAVTFNVAGTAGGTSTFAGFTAPGGGAGGAVITAGAAGSPNGAVGGYGGSSAVGNPGATTSTIAAITGFSFLTQGSTGGGGGGGAIGNLAGGAGGGSGIGTGGAGANNLGVGSVAGLPGIGIGSGGGGGSSNGTGVGGGGNGTPGGLILVI